MEEMETRSVYPVVLEVRQGGREIFGRFPYNSLATMASRGRVRKERFSPRAFRFAIDDPDREINLLVGPFVRPAFGIEEGGDVHAGRLANRR